MLYLTDSSNNIIKSWPAILAMTLYGLNSESKNDVKRRDAAKKQRKPAHNIKRAAATIGSEIKFLCGRSNQLWI